MFRETAGVDPISPEAIENAITESKLLHIRNLCELFCDPDAAKHDDDIKLKDLFDDWETNEARYSQLVKSRNDLCEAYGKGDPSRRATLNKRLAHTTKRRAESDGYNYTELVEVLKPKILKVFEDIEALRK